MSIDGRYIRSMNFTETLETNVDGVSTPNIDHDQFSTNIGLSATTSPAVTKICSDTIALVADAKTLDLTQLPQVGGGTFDATGLKLVAWLFKNRAGNTGDIVAVPGASTPYNFSGSSAKVTAFAPSGSQPPGEVSGFNGKGTNVPAVATDKKHIDVTGTGTEQFSYEFIFSD